MRFKLVIFMVVVGLSSCADQPLAGSERNGKMMDCQRLPNPQRAECLQDIPPDYNEYEQERQKLLKDKGR